MRSTTVSAGPVFAQSGLKQPVSVQQTAYEYSNYYQDEAQPSPSDKAPAAEPGPAPIADTATSNPGACTTCGGGGCAGGCDAGGGDDCCGDSLGYRMLTLGGLICPDCKLGEPVKLFDNECLKCNKINVSGYFVQSFTGNPSVDSTVRSWAILAGSCPWCDRS